MLVMECQLWNVELECTMENGEPIMKEGGLN